ncbi:hypothetical protein LWI28_005043 [Acer negundo]|uniref:Uncharacterized protein n=1 Tax=Acer negundo TaxID=4023 RepID=A0AAD5P5I7_ACENE|nr:hypothetical protein LWI28_005043 [Acer negundo]
MPDTVVLNVARVENCTACTSNRQLKPANQQGGTNFDNGRKNNPHPHCDYCDRDRHFRATCYKIHGFPPKQVESPAHQANQSISLPKSDDTSMVTAPMITQEQYNKLLSMLSLGSLNSNANLAGHLYNLIYEWLGDILGRITGIFSHEALPFEVERKNIKLPSWHLKIGKPHTSNCHGCSN